MFYSIFAALYGIGLGHFFIYCKTVEESNTFELVIHKLKFLTQWNSVSEVIRFNSLNKYTYILKDFTNFVFSVMYIKFNF